VQASDSGGVAAWPRPLTSTAPLQLHVQDLTWQALEHLVQELARQCDRANEARVFGRGGQAQNGVDVVGFFPDGSCSVYQAKRYEKFTAADLKRAVEAYALGKRPIEAQRLVVVTTADVRDTQIDLELVRLRDQHQDLVLELWGRQQLSDLLFGLPDVVRRFFGEDTMRQFCRPVIGMEQQGAASSGEVRAYLEQLVGYVGEDLHELVPLALVDEDAGERVTGPEMVGWLQPGRHVQVAGGAGTGKSHLLFHTTVGLARAGWLPILLTAGTFENRLDASLDESVAAFSDHSAEALVLAAKQSGMPVVLLVDAVNECPDRLRERLLQQLAAWCRRAGATLVCSGQGFVRLPAALQGVQLSVADLAPEQRQALLRSHGAHLAGEGAGGGSVEDPWAVFETPFELALAARQARQLPERADRAHLLEVYVRERLRETSQSTAVRQVLHHWALLMDEGLTGWLPVGTAQRSAAQLPSVTPEVVDLALGSPVVRVQGQRLRFRHEWFAQFLAAEALVWRCATPGELAGELRRPHRRGLAGWAVPLDGDPGTVRDLLRQLSDPELLAGALSGRLGPVADQVVLAEGRRCLGEAAAALAGGQVMWTNFTHHIVPGKSWSSYEQALFHAVGTTAFDGRLLQPLARLLRATDQAFRRGADGRSEQYRGRVPGLIAQALLGAVPQVPDWLPASWVVHAARRAWARAGHHPPASAAKLGRWVASLDAGDVGLLALLYVLLEQAGDGETAALAVQVFPLAWAAGAGQLQLLAFDMLTGIRSAVDAATEAAVIELLCGLDSDDVLVSTALFDALHIYGQTTSPYTTDDVAREIDLLLADPQQPDANDRARHILMGRFEEAVAEPFFEAIDALRPAERVALTVLAVSEDDLGFLTDTLLQDLINSKDPAALPTFEHWASHLDVGHPFPLSAVSCHLLGIEGCAAHLVGPPALLTGHEGADADAWRCYGQILFWLHRPGLGADERAVQCAPLWEELTTRLLDAASDPLDKFQLVAQFSPDIQATALGLILDASPAHIRTVLHHVLANPACRTSLFPHPTGEDRMSNALRFLAHVGDHSSVPVLAAYRDHPTLGSAAADTIRRLNNRTA
jgi:hypothetical protein